MIDRERFIAGGRERWKELGELLDQPSRSGEEWSRLARLYRGTCADLARARSEGLPADVQEFLDELSGRAHNAMYGGVRRRSWDPLGFALVEVPRQVRASAVWFWAAFCLFYGPALIAGSGAYFSEGFATQVIPAASLRQMEEMYGDGIGRAASEDAMMAGFYVYHNVGIAFRCFATGAFAGLGSVFFLVFNGTMIGAVLGHLFRTGRGLNLLEFTAGHTAWELTGIVLAGAAGLRMGWSMIATDGKSRMGSVQAAAPEVFRLVSGAAIMLFIAAAIEGFWSASPIPLQIKLAFGALQIMIVVAWLGFGGRR